MIATLTEPVRAVPVTIWRNPRNGCPSIIVGHAQISIAAARDLAHTLMVAADQAEADAARESTARLA